MAGKKRRKARMGRPPLPKRERTIRISVSLRRADADALRRLARSLGISASAVVAEALRPVLRKGASDGA